MSFPDLKGQAPLRRQESLHLDAGRMPPFPDLKGQAPLRPDLPDHAVEGGDAFPDLKGQAPLRRPRCPVHHHGSVVLFLTSKVRLHCDGEWDFLSSPFEAFS